MKIATFEKKDIEKVGVFYGEKLIDIDLLSQAMSYLLDRDFPIFFDIIDLIADLENVKKLLQSGTKLFKGEFLKLFSVKNPVLAAPISRETKVICLGKNYAEHAKETGSKPPEEPIIFGKFTDCIIAHNNEIIYPSFATRIDPEVELAVVIGNQCKNVPVNAAMDHVFGYTIANDVTDRDTQSKDTSRSWPWFRSKNFDTSLPIGPWIISKDEIPDPHNLEIELSVNGKVRQKGNTKDMIFKIDYLVSFISQYLTLYPGDIILTGTIAGIAPIKRGDEIICRIESIGELHNRVI